MSFINDYIKPSDFGSNRKDINKILALIHDIVAQEPEDEGLKQRILVANQSKIRTSTFTIGSPNLLTTDVLNKENFNWRRKKPSSVFTYNMVHTLTGTLTFPSSDTWDGARADNAGAEYITIDDDPRLDFTDEISICMKLILPNSAGGFVLCEKVGEYRLRVVDSNTIEWAVYATGAYKTAVTVTYTADEAFTIVAIYDTINGHRLYKDGSSVATDSLSGDFDNASGDLCLFATAGGTNIVPTGASIAYFGILNKEVSSGWVTDYHSNSLYDTSDGNLEITTINFMGDDRVTPDAETGLFQS